MPREPITNYDGTNTEDEWGHRRWLIESATKGREHAKPRGFNTTDYIKYTCIVCNKLGYRVRRPRLGGKPRTVEKHPECRLTANPAYGHNPETSLTANNVDPADSRATKYGSDVCGQPRGDGKPCQQPRGYKTDHPGYGSCMHHGGNTPAHTTAAGKEMAFKLSQIPVLGNKIDIDPHSAILDEVRRSYGHVEWLGMAIRMLGSDPDDPKAIEALDGVGSPRGMDHALHQWTNMGIQPSVWINMYQDERRHLVQTCKAAVAMGVAERQITLAEEQGRLIAGLLRAFLDTEEMEFTPAQLVKAPGVIRNLLLAIPQRASTEAPGATGRPERATTKVLREMRDEESEWEDV